MKGDILATRDRNEKMFVIISGRRIDIKDIEQLPLGPVCVPNTLVARTQDEVKDKLARATGDLVHFGRVEVESFDLQYSSKTDKKCTVW